MNKSFPLVMFAAMAVVTAATVWLIKRVIQPPTAAGKKRLTIFLRFVVAQSVLITALVVLSVEHVLQPRLLGVLGLANLIGSFLIMWAALKTHNPKVCAADDRKFGNRPTTADPATL